MSIDGLIMRKVRLYEDQRGFVSSLLRDDDESLGIKFVEQRFSWSKPNTVRGLHGDEETWKLMSIVSGKADFVFLDIRAKSFGQIVKASLSSPEEHNQYLHQILVPPGVLNGHFTKDGCCLYYAWSHYYGAEQMCVNPQDYFDLPEDYIISERDLTGPTADLLRWSLNIQHKLL